MTPQSAKAKGRRLQQWVVGKVLSAFPALTAKDVRSTSMGAGGVDVQLSEAAHQLFPFAVECKNRQAAKTLYDWYEQHADSSDSEPLLIIKRNGKKPLAVVCADFFINNWSKNGNP